ncbi:hypothetical protein Val02_11160 [Virgisporangium aliadipatigenens]|uniref:1-phosphatidylinositol phosphodiesterase n=2 Tax=Virgisporangium aliadipatigenens TaxID=741659 RepID=A0A8J4DMX0_9ACTN|nr:hypothetical protein Val02_11160 [Virgisporangium aliadipatigenens]
MRRTAAGLALALAASVVVVAATGGPASAADWYNSIEGTSPATRTWMTRVADGTSLAALSVPGTHDTLALCGLSTSDGGCEAVSSGITQTQERKGFSGGALGVQLNNGIRSIDIRVRVDRGAAGLTFTIHHGVYYQRANFTDVLTRLRDWLAANPRETVLLNLKAECVGAGAGDCYDAEGYATDEWRRRVFESYLDGRAYTGDGDAYRPATAFRDLFWAPAVSGTRAAVPTLGEVRGKVVLVAFRGVRGGPYDGYGLRELAGNMGEYVQDDYQVPTTAAIAGKWEKARTHLRRTNGVWDSTRAGEREYGHKPGDLYVNYTSGAGAGAFPYTVAGGGLFVTGVNQFLYQCLRNTDGRCPEFYAGRPSNFGGEASMRRTGVVMMDFPGGRLIDEIVARNFD